ncbi:alanine racemase [candidate division KSB1 bacterium]|nr:alanine racemase [candidate division KSB1 bacterium]
MITLNSRFTQNSDFTRPVLLVDKAKVMRHIESMQRMARANDLIFRPHFKTHQSADIGDWFRSFEVDKITVSSLDMAYYFAANGWKNITIAFLLNPNAIQQINSFPGDVEIHLVLDATETMQRLRNNIRRQVDVWIKIDCGLARTGVAWTDKFKIDALARIAAESDLLNFRGILTHAGQSYRSGSIDEIQAVHDQTRERMSEVKAYLIQQGHASCLISVGDTPTCSVANHFQGIDEIRPGNFVFYDISQFYIGSCKKNEIAVAVACPVVGKYDDRLQIVVHGGAVHLYKDSIRINDVNIYGYLTEYDDDHLGEFIENAPLISLSQEHGIVQLDRSMFSKINIGDIVLISPIHSCLTCDLYSSYRIMDENYELIYKFTHGCD